ncbi:MAG: UDP-N-acetylmuramate--L-alanine ligase, partial [Candidatus Paceibacteria bacterium]
MLDLEKLNKVHFIGIGGIGVSAIARMMLRKGKIVSGSDESPSEITKALEEEGAKIFTEHSAENITEDTDLVVYTVAIDKDNPELKKAKELEIETRTYSQMLGIISEGHYTVAVSGTHGKTTTTAMLAKVTVDSGLNPTVIVGSLMNGSNFISGNSDFFIVEACEYNRSFLDLNPNVLVITNIDEDHLDYYKDLTDIQGAFTELVSKLGEEDFVVCNPEDEKVKPVIENAKCKIVDYTKVENIKDLKVAGEYNQENAKAALRAAEILKVEKEKAVSSLQGFDGVWRRFEYKGKAENGAEI